MADNDNFQQLFLSLTSNQNHLKLLLQVLFCKGYELLEPYPSSLLISVVYPKALLLIVSSLNIVQFRNLVMTKLHAEGLTSQVIYKMQVSSFHYGNVQTIHRGHNITLPLSKGASDLMLEYIQYYRPKFFKKPFFSTSSMFLNSKGRKLDRALVVRAIAAFVQLSKSDSSILRGELNQDELDHILIKMYIRTYPRFANNSNLKMTYLIAHPKAYLRFRALNKLQILCLRNSI